MNKFDDFHIKNIFRVFLSAFKVSIILYIIAKSMSQIITLYFYTIFGKITDAIVYNKNINFFMMIGKLIIPAICLIIILPVLNWISDKSYVKNGFMFDRIIFKRFMKQEMSSIDVTKIDITENMLSEESINYRSIMYFVIGDVAINMIIIILSMGIIMKKDILLAFLILSFSFLPSAVFFNSKNILKENYNNMQERKNKLFQWETSLIKSIDFLKVNLLRNQAMDSLKSHLDRFAKSYIKINVKEKNINNTQQFFYDLSEISVYILAIIYIALKRITVGDIFVVITIGTYMIKSFEVLISSLSKINKLGIVKKRIETIIGKIEDSGDTNISSIDSIKFNNVSFKYPGNRKYVLKNNCMEVKSGDKIFIKSPNGSGKSTLCKLILGLYKCSSGEILINGKSFDSYNIDQLRNIIVCVPQKPYLWQDTVYNNIRNTLKRDDAVYCDSKNDEIIKIMEELKIDDIRNVIVKDNGANLSGGQVQKISIARALLKKGSFYILDEPYNNLDKSSMKFAKNYFEKLNKTMIIISHND